MVIRPLDPEDSLHTILEKDPKVYSDGSTETVVSYTDPSSHFFGSLFYIYNISHPISEDSNPIIGSPGTLIVLSAAMMRQTLFLAPEDSDDDVHPWRMAHNLEPKKFSRRRARGGANPECQPHRGDT